MAAQHHYMPSEIARLVLGYLRNQKCHSAAEGFLKESKHLSEYKDCLAEGYEYPLQIGGRSLVQIINKPFNDGKPNVTTARQCPPPPTTPRRTPAKVVKAAIQRSTPRKSETPRKLCDVNSPLDKTLTPPKKEIVEPTKIVGELINNPNVPDALAVAMNKILNCSPEKPLIAAINSGPWITDTGSTCEPINVPSSAQLDSILKELEKDDGYKDFMDDILRKMDVEAFESVSQVGSSSPFTGSEGVNSTLTTPRQARHKFSPISSGPASQTDYATSPSVVKNLNNVFRTPVKRATEDVFASSPFVPSSSPYSEAPFTPSKVFCPDFNVLTASPPQQPLLTGIANYLPILPASLTPNLQTATYAIISASPQEPLVDSSKLEAAIKAHRRIVPKGKCINSKLYQDMNGLKPKRKATDDEIRDLLKQNQKILPKNSQHTEQPGNYVTGRPRRKTFRKVARSLGYEEKKVAPKNKTGQLTANEQGTIMIDSTQLELLKNIDTTAINQVISEAHKLS
ncbi:hypothetical protein HDE_10810 [Halotydeus destructor]|nr:hypothetical protein HDE_10810 [Halotydeus destructor]